MRTYAATKQMGKAMDLLKTMESDGVAPDMVTYTMIAKAASNDNELDQALSLLRAWLARAAALRQYR
jgi:pentatricopeptide repeat protein